MILLQVCIKGIKSLLVCQVRGEERKETVGEMLEILKGAVDGIICQQDLSGYFKCWQLVFDSISVPFLLFVKDFVIVPIILQ